MATRTIPKRTVENLSACASVGLTYWSEHPAPSHLWAVDTGTGTYHAVRIDRRNKSAHHVCGIGAGLDNEVIHGRCAGTGDRATYTSVPSGTLDVVADLLGTPRAEPSDTAAAPPTDDLPVITAHIGPAGSTAGITAAQLVDAYTSPVTPSPTTPSPRPVSPARRRLSLPSPPPTTLTTPDATAYTRSLPQIVAAINHDPDYLDDLTDAELERALGHTAHDTVITAELESRAHTDEKESA